MRKIGVLLAIAVVLGTVGLPNAAAVHSPDECHEASVGTPDGGEIVVRTACFSVQELLSNPLVECIEYIIQPDKGCRIP